MKNGYEGESQYISRYDYMYLKESLEKLIKAAQEELEFVSKGSVDNSGYLIQSNVRQAVTQYQEERSRIQRKVDNAKSQRQYIRVKNVAEVKAREKATRIADEFYPLSALVDDSVLLKVGEDVIEGKLQSASKDRFGGYRITLFTKLKSGAYSKVALDIKCKEVEVLSVVKRNENWKYVTPALKRIEVLV